MGVRSIYGFSEVFFVRVEWNANSNSKNILVVNAAEYVALDMYCANLIDRPRPPDVANASRSAGRVRGDQTIIAVN